MRLLGSISIYVCYMDEATLGGEENQMEYDGRCESKRLRGDGGSLSGRYEERGVLLWVREDGGNRSSWNQ